MKIQKIVGFSLIAVGVVGGLFSNFAYGLCIVFVGLLLVNPDILSGKKRSSNPSKDSTTANGEGSEPSAPGAEENLVKCHIEGCNEPAQQPVPLSFDGSGAICHKHGAAALNRWADSLNKSRREQDRKLRNQKVVGVLCLIGLLLLFVYEGPVVGLLAVIALGVLAIATRTSRPV